MNHHRQLPSDWNESQRRAARLGMQELKLQRTYTSSDLTATLNALITQKARRSNQEDGRE